jgi:hypothetical protein
VDRGLRAPLLVITDGAAGLIGAVELVLAIACASGVWCIEAAKNQRVDVPVFTGAVGGVTEARSSVAVR